MPRLFLSLGLAGAQLLLAALSPALAQSWGSSSFGSGVGCRFTGGYLDFRPGWYQPQPSPFFVAPGQSVLVQVRADRDWRTTSLVAQLDPSGQQLTLCREENRQAAQPCISVLAGYDDWRRGRSFENLDREDLARGLDLSCSSQASSSYGTSQVQPYGYGYGYQRPRYRTDETVIVDPNGYQVYTRREPYGYGYNYPSYAPPVYTNPYIYLDDDDDDDDDWRRRYRRDDDDDDDDDEWRRRWRDEERDVGSRRSDRRDGRPDVGERGRDADDDDDGTPQAGRRRQQDQAARGRDQLQRRDGSAEQRRNEGGERAAPTPRPGRNEQAGRRRQEERAQPQPQRREQRQERQAERQRERREERRERQEERQRNRAQPIPAETPLNLQDERN